MYIAIFTFAVYGKEELLLLMDFAKTFQPDREMILAEVFYRNKPQQYFADIFESENTIMDPYVKDNNGDQANPINGQIDGLFFSISPRNRMMPQSPFGELRYITNIERLLNGDSNLYFADFYCMYKKYHYVTLVVCTPGTAADQFCAEFLPQLNLTDNNFLKLDPSTNQVSVPACNVDPMVKLYLEIFITDAVNMKDGEICEVPIRGDGCSKTNGIVKNLSCSKCNIYNL